MRVRYLSIVRRNSCRVTREVVLVVLTLTLLVILVYINWTDAILYNDK